jgi:hypothetical protein
MFKTHTQVTPAATRQDWQGQPAVRIETREPGRKGLMCSLKETDG